MRVLLVDDDVAVRDSMAIVLTEAGFKVVEAGNGMDAMRLLKASPPDLVITDILMPHKEGIEGNREIRRTAPAIPIIAISGGGGIGGQSDYLRMARVFGANAVLAKPFDPAELATLARRLVAAIRPLGQCD